jgi:SHAQKYF class myb-like DNA-binding protein
MTLYSSEERVSAGDSHVVQPPAVSKQGRWTKQEHLIFLKGLQTFGVGRWKEIGMLLPSRTNTQIKSHAQPLVARMTAGENIFLELEQVEAAGTAPVIVWPKQDSYDGSTKKPPEQSPSKTAAQALCILKGSRMMS